MRSTAIFSLHSAFSNYYVLRKLANDSFNVKNLKNDDRYDVGLSKDQIENYHGISTELSWGVGDARGMDTLWGGVSRAGTSSNRIHFRLTLHAYFE